MLQKYIELLKNATTAMGNLGHSGAGFQEYAKAVGYEFLLLGLGLLYLAIIVAVIAAPIVFIRKVSKKDCFVSARWKKYLEVRDKMKNFAVTYTQKIKEMHDAVYKQNPKEAIMDKLTELVSFLQDNGYEFKGEFPDIDQLIKAIKKGKMNKVARWLPDITPYEEYFNLSSFYDEAMFNRFYNIQNIKDTLNNLFPTYSKFRRAYVFHLATIGVVCVFALMIYLMLLIPFILVFF